MKETCQSCHRRPPSRTKHTIYLRRMPTHKASVFWIYGLSGAGKTTLSRLLAADLSADGLPCLVLDGDELRTGLNRGLGFSMADRAENIRRSAEVAKIACKQRFTVLAAFITPSREMRATAREIVEPLPFFELFLNCDFGTCAHRDVKGLYRTAADGSLRDFTGKDSSFELPLVPDLAIDTQHYTVEESLALLRTFVLRTIRPT